MRLTTQQLRANLEHYLESVEAGEVITLVRNDEVIAQLRPPTAGPGEPADHGLQRLTSQPWVRPGNGERVRGSDRPARLRHGTTADLLNWTRGSSHDPAVRRSD